MQHSQTHDSKRAHECIYNKKKSSAITYRQSSTFFQRQLYSYTHLFSISITCIYARSRMTVTKREGSLPQGRLHIHRGYNIYIQRDRASPRSQGLYTQRGVLSRAAALYRRFPQCTSIFAIKIAPVFSLPSGAV